MISKKCITFEFVFMHFISLSIMKLFEIFFLSDVSTDSESEKIGSTKSRDNTFDNEGIINIISLVIRSVKSKLNLGCNLTRKYQSK